MSLNQFLVIIFKTL